MRDASASGSSMSSRERFGHRLKVLERDPDRRSVRAHLHARGALRSPKTQIAFRREIDLAAERWAVERHFDDVLPGTAFDAVGAANARVAVDRDFERPHGTRNRAG